ncbi:helix-turn-helix domain-containing protein [Streptomyces sp. NBC_01803]|uniref:helix-turn-helix domain-containing protein n=1 Tax=Streptomyces sp. NBC_01803 TaxID=2975946 RepID=UPI002DD8AF9B|nr:helix-turn-helix transcriptional regulator [Streptomyces sp. NBC_01803]WSA43336.1 helix-turn-helix transcriptional regulator [Streptomyces sp. NBC_01803]
MDVGNVRAVLARKGLSAAEVARRIRYDAAYLSRVLNGRQAPSAALQRSLTELLDLDEDDERTEYVMLHPTRLDRAAVDALAGALAAQRRADDVVGPMPLLPAAETHRTVLLGLLSHARGPERDALAEVVAEHCAFLGWLHVQMRSDRAVSVLREGEQIAREIGSGPLIAQSRNFLACHWRTRGDHRQAAQHFDAVTRTEGVHLTQRAANTARAAEQTAKAGDKTAARTLLRAAERLGERAANQTPPEAAYWLRGQAFQLLNQGIAHAAIGDEKTAREHIAAGLAGVAAEHLSAPWISDYVSPGQLRELSPL